jgi:transposase InsO family protein
VVALSSVHIPIPDRDTSSPGVLRVCLHSRTSSPNRDNETWHSRLGHTGTDKIRSMLRTGQLPTVQNAVHCNECVLGKQHRHPCHGSIATATRPGEVIHSDVVGPLPPSHSKSCYLVTFVDEFTRYVTIFALIRKSAVLDSFKFFIVNWNISIQLQSRLSTQTTGGSTHQLSHTLYKLGISVHLSSPYTPKSNGIAERQNRSIFETARITLTSSRLPPTYWVESVKTLFTFVINSLMPAGLAHLNPLFTERSRHRQCGDIPKRDSLGHLQVPIRDNE